MQNSYRPEKKILELGADFYDPVQPAKFPNNKPRYLNHSAAAQMGLSDLLSSDEAWIQHFSLFESLPGSLKEPLALRYHGHQFRSYNPELGDGRGFLFAQARCSDSDRLMDFGTKGSGQTPYSRSGDGRLTLKGAVREALATEMLEALGVNTSRTFCFFETGEALQRSDEPSPTRSAVLTRLSHSHIRIGAFERLAYLGEKQNISRLTQYCLTHLLDLPDLAHDKASPVHLYKETQTRLAQLTAQWMMAGFVHGVLNSDNINITGESFDYGPYRFLPHYDPNFTAAYFDHTGLYSYGRQPPAIHWNLAQLAQVLSVIDGSEDLQNEIDRFPVLFVEAMRTQLLRRLGLSPTSDAENFLNATFSFLSESRIHFEGFFFDFFGRDKEDDSYLRGPRREFYQSESFFHFQKIWKQIPTCKSREHSVFVEVDPPDLRIEAIESLWDDIAQRDDWSSFDSKVSSIRRYAEALRQ